MERLYRSRDNKYLFGICGGIGEYFNIDPTIVRLIVVVLALVNLASSLIALVIFYIVAYFIIPEHPDEGGQGKGRQKDKGEKEGKNAPKEKSLTTRPRKK